MVRIGEHEDVHHVRDVRRVTWIGLAANLFLAAFKIVAGVLGSSQAVIADGFNSISDTATDVAILIGVRYWTSPADETHPYGHRRIETVITGAIAVVIAFLAGSLIYGALVGLHERHEQTVGMIAFAAAVVSILCKEVLYRWTVRVGRRARSSAVIAKAWDHRSDVFTSMPVAAAVLGARYLPTWWFLDHIGALLVSLIILRAGWRIGWPALQELTDIGAPEAVRERIRAIAMATDGVLYVHAIRTRYVGPVLLADLHVKVNGAMTVREGHDISELVKERLIAEGPDIVDVVVHLEPYKGERDANGK